MQRVLLVDDDPLVRRSLRRFLVQLGFDVEDFPDAIEALVPLHAHPFACVLTDYHLPKHDGLWLLAQARLAQPDAVRILCSGADVGAEHIASGLVNAVLLKPFQIERLLSLLPDVAS